MTLCRRIAKVDNIRFLDRHGISALINALDGWAASKAKRAANPPADRPEGTPF